MKLAIIGSRTCQKTKQVKELLFKAKQKFKEELIILSGGNDEGIEFEVKKYSLQFGIKYEEYNPSFTGKNEYSAMYDEYYGKSYRPNHYLHRYILISAYADMIVIGHEPESPEWYLFQAVEKNCIKKSKKIVFI